RPRASSPPARALPPGGGRDRVRQGPRRRRRGAPPPRRPRLCRRARRHGARRRHRCHRTRRLRPGHQGAHRLRMGRGAEDAQAREEEATEGSRPMNSDMMEALENIEREKGISVEIMLEALANALVTAYKRLPNAAEEALVEIDAETGDIRVIAQELDEEGNVTRERDDTREDFGRIAAQPAQQETAQ